MAAPPVRPLISDLVFQLHSKPLHPELFEILAQRKVTYEDADILVRITRTGHVISWHSATAHLSEVTAATDQLLPEQGRRLSHRLRNEHCTSLQITSQLHYQAAFQVETLPPDLFLQIHNEILVDGSKRGLLHHFPSHHRLSVAPLGFITVEARPGCVFLSSFHTFPAEHTVVKTQSLIEKR